MSNVFRLSTTEILEQCLTHCHASRSDEDAENVEKALIMHAMAEGKLYLPFSTQKEDAHTHAIDPAFAAIDDKLYFVAYTSPEHAADSPICEIMEVSVSFFLRLPIGAMEDEKVDGYIIDPVVTGNDVKGRTFSKDQARSTLEKIRMLTTPSPAVIPQ